MLAHFKYKKGFGELTKKLKILGKFNKNKIPELRNSTILVLLNKDKIFELRNSKMLFLLKILSYEEVTMTSQFDLTQFVTS